MSFVYDDGYHLDLSTVVYKALYDDMRVASLVNRIRQVCHYESLVIRDVTERSVLFMKDWWQPRVT